MAAITHAQIEPTTRCNFTCGFCAGRAMPQADLAWADFTAFLDLHPQLKHVELQGEGEPLLHPRFFDMAAACAARGIAVGLITNGSLLGEAMVRRLLDAGLASIHVSLETTDPARFRAIRGGLFAKVEQGIARLMAARSAREATRPVVGLAVTLLADTLGDMADVHDLYAAHRLDGGIACQPLQPMPAYARHYDAATRARAITPALAPRANALRAALARLAPITGVRGFFYAGLFAGFDPARHDCPWLDHGAYLDRAGRVTGCCFMKDDALGRVRVDPPAAIATRRAALSAALAGGVVPTPCAGCSTARAVAARGSAVAADGVEARHGGH